MSWLPDDVREASGGEVVEEIVSDVVRQAYRALDRFPELVRRHKFVAGGAAVSSALVVMASVAVARRMRRGQSAEDAVNSVTEEEVLGAGVGARDEDAAARVGDEWTAERGVEPDTDAEQGPYAVAQQAGSVEVAYDDAADGAAGRSEPAGEFGGESADDVPSFEADAEQGPYAMAQQAGSAEVAYDAAGADAGRSEPAGDFGGESAGDVPSFEADAEQGPAAVEQQSTIDLSMNGNERS